MTSSLPSQPSRPPDHEPSAPVAGTAVGALIYGPARSFLIAFLILSVAALLGVCWLNARNTAKLEQIRSAVEHSHQVQSVGLELTRLQLAATEGAPLNPADVERVHRSLTPFLDPSANLDPASAQAFARASAVLMDTQKPPELRIALSQRALREATYAEVGAGSEQLARSVAGARTQAAVGLAAFAALPMLGLLAFVLIQRRVAGTLDSLHALLTRLAQGRFVPVGVRSEDPILCALFDNFNRAVARLEELEQSHRAHAQGLEQEVRRVTQRLMDQQHALARSERLAAVGELAASIAHELRNPLAGIQFALANIRDSTTDPELQDRSAAILRESQRMARLLQDLLSPVRAVREVRSPHDLLTLMQEFSELAAYQAPPGVRLVLEVPSHLQVWIPAESLRQALLNLVLNAFQAMLSRAGEVHLAAARDGDALVLSVRDSGPGFPISLIEDGVQVFRSGRESGTGLGLAIVQRFAQDFGGELAFRNLPAAGGEVRLILPSSFHTGTSELPSEMQA